jgi:hypothetical protein
MSFLDEEEYYELKKKEMLDENKHLIR